MNFDTFFRDLVRETQILSNPKIIENEKRAIRFSSFIESQVFTVSPNEVESDELAARILEAVNLYRDLTFAHTGIPKNASFISTVAILETSFQSIEEETHVDVRRLITLEDFLDAAQSMLGENDATRNYFIWANKSAPRRKMS